MSGTLLERGLKEKPVPVSADALFIMDSENGMVTKYILWDDVVAAIGGSGGGLTHPQVMARVSLGL